VQTAEGSSEQKRFQLVPECRNQSTDDEETTLSGSAFQILATATGKAWLPIVDSLRGGTTKVIGK